MQGILQPDELRKEMQDNGAAIIGALNDQWITLQLLGGKIPTTIEAHSRFFEDMLSHMASQSGLSGEQLSQSQFYDVAMLENAALTALMLDIFSGNVKGVADKLEDIAKCGGDISADVAGIAPLLEQMGGNGGDGVNGAASTVFGSMGPLVL